MRKPLKRLERAKGFEPSVENSEVVEHQCIAPQVKAGYTQIHTQTPDALCPELSQIIAAWSKLSAPLKAAILAIINSSEGAR